MFVNIRFRWSHTCNFLKSVCPTNLEFHKLQSMLLNVLWEITDFLKGIHALYSWLKTYRVLKRFSLVKMEKLPQNLFKFQIKVNLSHRWQSKKLISKLMIISTGMWKKCLAYFLITRAFSKTTFLSVLKKLYCSDTLLSGAEREQRDSRSAHYS